MTVVGLDAAVGDVLALTGQGVHDLLGLARRVEPIARVGQHEHLARDAFDGLVEGSVAGG